MSCASMPALFSVAHEPWPVCHGPWPICHGSWPMGHGPWPMGHGPWPMGHGPRATGHGPWPRPMGHGSWAMAQGQITRRKQKTSLEIQGAHHDQRGWGGRPASELPVLPFNLFSSLTKYQNADLASHTPLRPSPAHPGRSSTAPMWAVLLLSIKYSKDQVPCRRILGNIVVTLRIGALHTFKRTPGSL